MKKTEILVIAMAFIFSVAMTMPAKAETRKSEKQSCPMAEMMGKDMKEKEWKGCRKGEMPMHCMMSKQMIATLDGGIVVSICNKLYKYDSNLNLQKEIEIPFDMECMKKMLMDMKDKGTMDEKMEKQDEPMSKETTETKTKE